MIGVSLSWASSSSPRRPRCERRRGRGTPRGQMKGGRGADPGRRAGDDDEPALVFELIVSARQPC